MKGRGLAVHTNIRQSSAGTNQFCAELERLRNADCLDSYIGTEAIGQVP